MKPSLVNGNVKAVCPTCETMTTFEYKHGGSSEFGTVVVDEKHEFDGITYHRLVYKLLRCANCGRGGLASVHLPHNSGYSASSGALGEFLPFVVARLSIPPGVPSGVANEFRESETCASVGAWRAGSGLLRSTLEKVLKINGYSKGSLYDRINEAAGDGVITNARRQRAHDNVRVLGNDVLHDDWREVGPEEYEQAHHYTQRILEDLYDDRSTVESLLKASGKLQ